MISGLVGLVFQGYLLVVTARVILRWMSVSSQSRVETGLYRSGINVALLVYRLTEPLLKPIRSWLRPHQRHAPVDFSPFVLGLALMVVEGLLVNGLRRVGL